MDNSVRNLSDDDLEELEDRLLREEEEKRKAEMLVSGKSVFEIDRIKKLKTQHGQKSD